MELIMDRSPKNSNMRSPSMSELSEQRLWKLLDDISHRLIGIETQLNEVVRLEERVNNQEQTLRRFGSRLDTHESRIHDSELWQARQGDRDSVERLIVNVQKELKALDHKVENIKDANNINKGQKDIAKEVLKWLVGILTAILIYKITKG